MAEGSSKILFSSKLLRAVNSSNSERVIQLLKDKKNNPCVKNSKSESLLMIAAKNNDVKTMMALIEAAGRECAGFFRVEPEKIRFDSKSSFFGSSLALRTKDEKELMEIFCGYGRIMYINMQDSDGYTALTHAAKNGAAEAVAYLLKHGAYAGLFDTPATGYLGAKLKEVSENGWSQLPEPNLSWVENWERKFKEYETTKAKLRTARQILVDEINAQGQRKSKNRDVLAKLNEALQAYDSVMAELTGPFYPEFKEQFIKKRVSEEAASQKINALCESALRTTFEYCLNYVDGRGNSLLHMLCIAGNHTILERILECLKTSTHLRVDFAKRLEVVEKNGPWQGCPVAVLRPMLSLVDLNIKNPGGYTPLHIACSEGYDVCANMLLARGANFYARNNEGKTALHLAVNSGQLHCVKMLLDWEDHIIRSGKQIAVAGKTSLHKMVMQGLEAAEKLLDEHQLLTDKTAKRERKTKLIDMQEFTNLDTALHLAAARDYNITKEILSRDPKIMPNKTGQIPEEISKSAGDAKITMLIKDYIKGRDLCAAVANGKFQKVQKLVGIGAPVTFQSSTGETPIEIAQRAGHQEILEYLLKQSKHKISAKDADHSLMERIMTNIALRGYSMLGWETEVFELLLKQGNPEDYDTVTGLNSIHWASYYGHIGVLKIFKKFALGKEINWECKSGVRDATPLHLAVSNGHFAVAKFFLEEGVAVDALDGAGCTPLYWAIVFSAIECADLLLLHGADIKFGQRTPLERALSQQGTVRFNILKLMHVSVMRRRLFKQVAKGRPFKVQSLLKRFKSLYPKDDLIHYTDKHGNTALHIALEKRGARRNCVNVLLKYGSSLHIINDKNLSPLDLLNDKKSGDRSEIQKLLLSVDVQNMFFYIKNGEANKLKTLLAQVQKNNLNIVSQIDKDGNTPLHIACLVGNSECVYTLLKYKADVNSLNCKGLSPLQLAVMDAEDKNVRQKEKSFEVFAKQIMKDLKIEFDVKESDIPFHKFLYQFVSLLTENDENRLTVTRKQETMRDYKTCSLECVNILLKSGADPVQCACSSESIRKLIEQYRMNRKLRTIILKHQYVEGAKQLLLDGCDTNLEIRGKTIIEQILEQKNFSASIKKKFVEIILQFGDISIDHIFEKLNLYSRFEFVNTRGAKGKKKSITQGIFHKRKPIYECIR